MEATADTLLNQVADLFLSKIDKQNIDPKFLQKFTDQLLGKLSYTSSEPIKQKTTPPPQGNTNGSLVEDLKKVYEDIIKTDSTYKTNYKSFLRYVLPEELLKQSTENVSSSAEKPEIKTAETPEIKATSQKDEGRAKLIDKPDEPQKVILAGITESASRSLKGKFSDIFKGFFDKLKFNFESPKGGLGLLGGGIALLLGGLAALVTGLMTDGPFKGLLKILSTSGLTGGLKLLEIGAKTFINTLKNFIDAPIKLLDTVGTGLKGTLSSLLPKGIGNIVKGTANIFVKMLSGLVKFITPLLKKLPLIGTVISFGFAYTRFKSGDTVGGIIDILSGLVGLLSLTGVGAAVAIPIQIGLDVLSAFLDYKGGGANEKTTQKKTGLLKEWALGLGKILYEGIKYIPIIGPYMQAVEDMQSGKWLDATYNLVRAIPGLGGILDIINYFTEGKTEESIKGGLSQTGDKIGEWLSWVRESIWDKITGFVTGVFDSVKDWWNNLSWDPKSWIPGITPEPPKQSPTSTSEQTSKQPTSQELSKASASQPIMMAEGGIVTQPINAVVGEAGPEAVLPLEKYFNPQNLSLSNTTLEEIASNTSNTNSSLKVLSDALFKLIVVLDKKTSQTSTTVINSVGRTTQQNTPASVIANTNVDPIRRVRMQFA
jgi:hypothetical protein